MNSRKLFTSALLSMVCLALSQPADAIPISGKVDMVGTANFDSADISTATSVTAFGPATVIPTPNGAFIGTAGSAVTFTPFSWSPASTPVSPLWSFVSGGWTYTFDLTGISSVSQNSFFLNIVGSGTLEINGVGSPYDPTDGLWTFTSTSAGPDPEFRFGFVSSTVSTPSVPDGGSVLTLMSIALAGLAGLRRFLLRQ